MDAAEKDIAMGLRAIFGEALPDVFTEAGEAAIFTPSGGAPVPCFVIPAFNVMLQPAGMEAQAWQRGTTIEALLSDVSDIGIGTTEPNRGDTFLVDGATYTVQSVLENDGLIVKVVVK